MGSKDWNIIFVQVFVMLTDGFQHDRNIVVVICLFEWIEEKFVFQDFRRFSLEQILHIIFVTSVDDKTESIF